MTRIRVHLIGGLHDGQEFTLPDFIPSIRFPIPQQIELNAITSDYSYPTPIKIEEYLFVKRMFNGLYVYRVREEAI
jgi:hypothetical protein